MSPHLTYRSIIKPFFDYLIAASVLIVLSPLMLGICFVYILMGKPVLFIQSRPGLNGELFNMIKFKTLNEDGSLFRFGNFLRLTSLDELPQLFNILRGEMSFVGPRPLFKSYLKTYRKDQIRRHDVKPGITGWAQVNGRNKVNLDEKVAMDLHYIESQSFRVDLKVLLLTANQLTKLKESDYHQVHSDQEKVS